MNRRRVLVVEDDEGVRELVSFHLSRAAFEVVEAASAEEAWGASRDVDLVVLDWMLPGLSGLEWLRRLRRGATARVPVLMLTARATESERVEGLESGADDYLVKPFSAAELVARVRALLRRTEPLRRLTHGSLTVDIDRAEVYEAGARVELTRREFDLLAFLVAHPGRVFSRGDLLDRVWGQDFLGTERTVDQHVAQLRARLPEGAARIETVRGRGYRLVSADTR